MLDLNINKNTDTFNPYLIREITSGYSDLVKKDGNPMYEAYKTGYNMLFDDLQRTKAEESPTSFHVILDKAASNIFQLHQRSASNCEQIVNFSNHFLNKVYHEANRLDSEAGDFLSFAFLTWKDALENNRLREGIECIRSQYYLIQFNLSEDLEIEIFGDVKTLVLGALEKIEEKIVEAAEKFKVYQGLSNAHSYALTKGSLIPFEDFYESTSNLSSGLQWYGPYDKSIRELFNYGHTLKTACNIRFINLTDEEGMSSTDAYNSIDDELEKLGVNPADYLPGDPKNMLDRCNRLKKSRMEELKKITRKDSR